MHGELRRSEIDLSAGQQVPLWRLRALTLVVLAGFLVVAWELASLGQRAPVAQRMMVAENQMPHAVSRPDTVDRNGRMLASDIRVYWLFADPSQIIGIDDTLEKLSRVLAPQDMIGLRAKLSSKSRFEWVKRGLTPNEAASVHHLGLAGLYLLEEPQRVYPAGDTAVHILGHTNVDNQGLAGIEKFIDSNPEIATPAEEPPASGRASGCRSICASSTPCMRRSPPPGSTFRPKPSAASSSMCSSGEVLAMAGCPITTPTGARNRSPRTGATASITIPTSWARCSRPSPSPWRSMPASPASTIGSM